jgi:hypothetical protein
MGPGNTPTAINRTHKSRFCCINVSTNIIDPDTKMAKMAKKMANAKADTCFPFLTVFFSSLRTGKAWQTTIDYHCLSGLAVGRNNCRKRLFCKERIEIFTHSVNLPKQPPL